MKGSGAPRDAVATDTGRWYEWKGERFLSVTNVLDRTISKPVLVPWASKLVAEYAKTHPGADIKEWKQQPKIVKETSAQRGTDIHAWFEQYCLDPVEAEGNMPRMYVAECLGIIEAMRKHRIVPIAAEATGYNREHRYAGTVDLFAEVAGEVWCIDLKTGKGCYPEYGLQISAYANAEFLGLPDGTEAPVPPATAFGVLHVQGMETKLIEFYLGEEEWEAFQAATKLGYWLVQSAREVMLPPA